MAVTLDLPPELEQRIKAQALAQGLSLETYLLSIVEAGFRRRNLWQRDCPAASPDCHQREPPANCHD